MKSYIAVVRERGAGYVVSFPDLPGCEAEGETIKAARRKAAHLLAVHMQDLIKRGDVIPAPSSLIEIVSDAQWRSEGIDSLVLAVRPIARTGNSE